MPLRSTAMPAPVIGIIMGSVSDWETLCHAAATLDQLGVPHECRVVSAHRTPDLLMEYAASAEERGFEVIIAGAGGAAHLPGMAAAKTLLPVLGVPVESQSPARDRLAALHRPDARRRPGGTLAIGKAGAINAALLAASIVGDQTPGTPRGSSQDYRAAQTQPVLNNPDPRLRPSRGPDRESRHPRRRPARPDARPGRLPARPPLPRSSTPWRPGRPRRRTDPAAATTTPPRSTRFAPACDVVTYEFENVPARPPPTPGDSPAGVPPPAALETAQDRLAEKHLFTATAASPTPRFAAVSSRDELAAAVVALGLPAVLKTRRFGYDGKGQAVLRPDAGR